MTRLCDPTSTIAIVLGAHDWTRAGLTRARSFRRSASRWVGYLLNQPPNGLGIDAELLLNLFDDPSPAGAQLARIVDITRSLIADRADSLKPVTDVLVYYIGHGSCDDGLHLHLLVRDSSKGIEEQSSISAPDLAHVLRVSAPKQRRVVILDCCFSEAALEAFGAMSTLEEAVATTAMNDLAPAAASPEQGTVLFCSSPRRNTSIGRPDAPQTLFTGALVSVLTDGVPSRKSEMFSFSALRDDTYDKMIFASPAEIPPRPALHQPEQQFGNLLLSPAFPNFAYLREKAERERREKEQFEAKARAEQERLETERKARTEQERLETERKARAEQERLETERKARAEQERLETERKARAEQERLETERKARAEQERLETERKARAEQERLETERKARAEQEREQEERERLAAAEQERLQKQWREEAERERQEKREAQAERDRLEKLAKELAEAEMVRKVQAENKARQDAAKRQQIATERLRKAEREAAHAREQDEIRTRERQTRIEKERLATELQQARSEAERKQADAERQQREEEERQQAEIARQQREVLAIIGTPKLVAAIVGCTAISFAVGWWGEIFGAKVSFWSSHPSLQWLLYFSCSFFASFVLGGLIWSLVRRLQHRFWLLRFWLAGWTLGWVVPAHFELTDSLAGFGGALFSVSILFLSRLSRTRSKDIR
jgi:hypothetical protein